MSNLQITFSHIYILNNKVMLCCLQLQVNYIPITTQSSIYYQCYLTFNTKNKQVNVIFGFTCVCLFCFVTYLVVLSYCYNVYSLSIHLLCKVTKSEFT